jgi:hypothetical protein
MVKLLNRSAKKEQCREELIALILQWLPRLDNLNLAGNSKLPGEDNLQPGSL